MFTDGPVGAYTNVDGEDKSVRHMAAVGALRCNRKGNQVKFVSNFIMRGDLHCISPMWISSDLLQHRLVVASANHQWNALVR